MVDWIQKSRLSQYAYWGEKEIGSVIQFGSGTSRYGVAFYLDDVDYCIVETREEALDCFHRMVRDWLEKYSLSLSALNWRSSPPRKGDIDKSGMVLATLNDIDVGYICQVEDGCIWWLMFNKSRGETDTLYQAQAEMRRAFESWVDRYGLIKEVVNV